MTRDPQAIADHWANRFDRAMWWMKDAPGARVRSLAHRLVFSLALMELDWADPVMREAASIRADGIVSEIGWPKASWLRPRVEREISWRNAVHVWLTGNGPDPFEDQIAGGK